MATATVMHGRRKGKERATPEMPLPPDFRMQGTKAGQPGMILPNGTDLRDVTILSKNEWNRIQQELYKRQIEEERMRRMREEKENRKQMSKEMVKNWGNTIAGTRTRKLEARKLREQKEEEEKRAIDLEEAKYQAEKRKEAIEKAKTQQYYQTDRVKNFHSALMLTEVLKEREAQIELKKLKEKASEGKDAEWLQKARREHENAILHDQERAKERIKASKENEKFLTAQIQEHVKQRHEEVEEDKREGEELQKLAIQFHAEKERLEEIKRAEKLQMMRGNMDQIKDRKMIKQVMEQQEEEEDEECRIFAAAKRKMMKLRAEKEQQIHNEKQRNLEQIREKLAAQLKQKVSDEDERIHRAVEEAEEKRAKEEAEKEAKLRKDMEESAKHRNLQMREAEQKKKEERRQELEMVRIRQAADEIFRRNEEEKHMRRREDAVGLKHFHQEQVNQRKQKEVEQEQEKLALDQANQALLAVEEDQFQEYAGRVIEHCEKGGRNVYPLRKAAKNGAGGGKGPVFEGKGGIRPSYMVSDKSGKQMPHYQRDSTEETKDSIYGQTKSKKRLGFVW
ncbi:cilia- and flagella- associated protein 210-like [Saccostrea cucullata]|uniref:cilia- and flagella- associated protein 210-like n=1 Tax=Saccostrea cuccullata TaxID=36930 RepID=UPI002ED053AD